MKNLKLIALGMILFTAIGCKDLKKTSEDQTSETQTTEGTYTVVNDSTK
jgi:hypothetical protein